MIASLQNRREAIIQAGGKSMDTPASIPIGQKIRLRMRKATWHDQRIDWSGYVFLLPFFIPFLTFTVVAIIFGAYIAFNDWGIMGAPEWVGLANFKEAFTDEWVLKAFVNILRYGLIIVPGVTILALTFAVYVNKRWFLSDFARAAFYSPNVVSATVIGLVWVWILDTQFGLVNKYLNMIGIPNIPWLTSTQWSLIGVSIASIWWDLGFSFVLFLAALQEIPREIQEAAEIDGASGIQSFWYVSVPILRPTISMIVTLQLIATMRIFSQVYMMTNGGPAGSSVSVIHYIYTTAIVRFRLGYAAAVSLMLFVVILIVTLIQQRLIRESD
jgi:ABC-type sugar transport system permease subunit